MTVSIERAVATMIAAALLVLYDTPGKRLPSLHAQVFAPLRSVLDACRWHAAPFAGQRTANGFAVSCLQYRSITEILRRKQEYDHKYI